MARHSSPHGAGPADPDRNALPGVPAVPGGHRLPTPPGASLRGRATVVAAAAGAIVAAGQTLVEPFVPATGSGVAPLVVSALLPVAEVATPVAGPASAGAGIGGDQLLPGPLARGPLDAASGVDVQNLAKAVDIGNELARHAAIIDSALADGASEAHLFGDSVYVRPTVGRLTSVYGLRWGTSHNGIDIANSIGTPIHALTHGVVEDAGPASGFGLWVKLRHPDGTQSVYGHVNRMFVEPGQEVRAGELIAEIGNRGFSTGPHLHMEIWDAEGGKINPIPYLRKHGIDVAS